MDTNGTVNACGYTEEKKCCTTIVKNYYGCGGNRGCKDSDMDLSDYATIDYVNAKISEIETGSGCREVEFNRTDTVVQWRYSGDLAWNDLFNIPQPSLVFSPHKWPSNTEVDLGDESYGMRFTGTITQTANVENTVSALGLPINMKTIAFGGCWSDGNNSRSLPIINDNMTTGAGTIQNSSRIHLLVTGELYIRTKSSTARTNAPYDIWIRYTKA